jgi:hypothetical protein
MDIIKLYYYTSIPLTFCNLIFYSITNLSNSITSSQNVSKFIYDHKDCDSIIFAKELDNLDILNKLNLIEIIFFDIIKKNSNNEEEYNNIIKYIKQDKHFIITENEMDFVSIDINNFSFDKYELFNKISNPIKFSIITIYEIINKLTDIITNANKKINDYNKNYLKKLITFSLKNEITDLKYYSNKLDKRFETFIALAKIYK